MARNLLAIAVIAVGIHASAFAQEANQGALAATNAANSLSILTTPAAREDLKLNDEQVSALRQLQGDHFAAVEAKLQPLKGLPAAESAATAEPIWRELAADANGKIAEILDAEQVKRLRQIMLQMNGYSALLEADVRDALELSDEQKAKVLAIRERFSKEAKTFISASKEDRQAMGTKLMEFKNKATLDALALLSDEQKARWGELIGRPFALAELTGAPRAPSTATIRTSIGQGQLPGAKAAMEAQNRLSILSLPIAQDELKLKVEQLAALRPVAEETLLAIREGQQGLPAPTDAEAREKAEPMWKELAARTNGRIAEILEADQLKRLDQIMLQLRGHLAFLDSDMQETLRFTEEQKAKAGEIREAFGKAVTEAATASKDDREAAASRFNASRKQASEAALGLLTEEQRARWAELIGERSRLAGGNAGSAGE